MIQHLQGPPRFLCLPGMPRQAGLPIFWCAHKFLHCYTFGEVKGVRKHQLHTGCRCVCHRDGQCLCIVCSQVRQRGCHHTPGCRDSASVT